LGAERLSCERSVPQLQPERRGSLGVRDRFAEPLPQPEEARGHAFMRLRERLAISLGLVDRLEEELGGLRLHLVGPDAREPDERPRPFRSGRQPVDDRTELRLRPGRIARLEVEVRSVNRAAQLIVGTGSGSQLTCPVEQKGACTGRAAESGTTRGVLERSCDDVVRLLGGRGQMPSPRLGIVDELRQPGVHFGTAKRTCHLVGARCEQRMREADPVAVELHDPRLERG